MFKQTLHDNRFEPATASFADVIPAAIPWFLRLLKHYPVPTILGVAGGLMLLRHLMFGERSSQKLLRRRRARAIRLAEARAWKH